MRPEGCKCRFLIIEWNGAFRIVDTAVETVPDFSGKVLYTSSRKSAWDYVEQSKH